MILCSNYMDIKRKREIIFRQVGQDENLIHVFLRKFYP